MGFSRIVREPIDPGKLVGEATAGRERVGGTVAFIGIVRRFSRGKEVSKLYYEVYEEMAEDVLEEIRLECLEKFGLIDAFIVHRVGELKVGEVSLVVIALDERRAKAFKAAAWMVDEVKRRAPIWKKEYYTDGTAQWISGH